MPALARSFSLALLCLLCAPPLLAQPTPPITATLTAAPRLFRLSSTFHPADGLAAAPVESVVLAIYAQESGGAALWQETQSVAVDSDGGYLVLLGLTRQEGLPLELFATGEARWLGMQFLRAGEGDQPRMLLTGVPYALMAARAADADTLGGRPASAYMLAGTAAGTAGSASGQTAGTGGAVTTTAQSAGPGSAGATAPVQSTGVTRKVSAGTAGTIGKFTNATDLGDSVLFENSGKIGLGNTAPLDFIHVQFTDGGGVFTGYGVRNLSAAAGAYSGMLFFDQNGALAQFQGFNNATHEYRINNIASGGTINFMLGSSSKFLVRADGDVEIPGSLRKGGALFLHNRGTNNFAAGINALPVNTTGSNNVATGVQALLANTTGLNNVATGNFALLSNTTGTVNTASGTGALQANTTGGGNVATGSNALLSNTTGTFNTAIGASANVSSGALTNATAIGNLAVVDASNKIRLGNTAVTVIEGQVAYTFPSDKTRKENFQPANPEAVLRKVGQLPVTSWNYIGHDPRLNRHYGPMAQDFYAAFGDDGVGRIGTETTINSGDWSAVLMLAVQALEQRSEVQIARIAELELDRQAQSAVIARQTERIAGLEKQTAAIAMLQEQMAALQAAGLTAARRDTGILAAAR